MTPSSPACSKRQSGLTAAHGPNLLFWPACFLAPIALLIIVSMWNGVYPFGAESFLTEDLKYQYIDFFVWFKRVFAGDANIFYSFAQGMGSNTWGLYSYYLASPFNLLTLLFDEKHLTLAVYVIVALKLACMNTSMAWYLRRRFNVSAAWALALALCYSWSTWTLTNLRNPLWLDALILLPLMAWCCYRLIRERSFLPLGLLVAADIITCWYMAYITLLFCCLFVLFELSVLGFEDGWPSIGQIAARAGRFTGAIALGIGLSAWTFIPTIMAMAGGSSLIQGINLQMTSKSEIVKGLLPGMWTLNVTPQLYAGIIPLVLALLFLLSKRIPARLRLTTLAFGAFLIASTLFGPLMYVWCGMRMPNGFYCRIAFLVSFMEIWAAGYFLMSRHSNASKTSTVTHPAFKPALAHTALLALAALDLILNAHICWNQLYVGYPQATHDAYVAETEHRTAELKELDRDAFYRVDKTYNRAGAAFNEGLSYGFNQLSTYSSANSPKAVAFLNAMGYSSPGEVSSAYAGPNLVMDSLLGVRYIDTWGTPPQNEQTALETSSNGATISRNGLALSLGYPSAQDAANTDMPVGDNPFERQNTLFAAITGVEEPLYTPLQATASSTNSSDGITWEVKVPAGTIGYTYVVRGDGVDGYHPVILTIDATVLPLEGWRFANNVRDLGNAASTATQHTVSIAPADGQESISKGTHCVFYALNIDLFKRAITDLQQRDFEPNVFEDGYVQGPYHADNNTQLVLSIPFDAGWNVTVNGKQMALSPAFGGGMSTIELRAGDNEIKMEYTSPGMGPGLLVTAISVIVLAGATARFAMKRKREGR